MKKSEYESNSDKLFEFSTKGAILSEAKNSTRPIGYFEDAFSRFRKNKASLFAAMVIICIVLFALLIPIFSNFVPSQMDTYYAKLGPRVDFLKEKLGIFTGGVERTLSEKRLIHTLAIGIGAEDYLGKGAELDTGVDSPYQPVYRLGDEKLGIDGKKRYSATVDSYLEVGFIYTVVEQDEYKRILEWERENGERVIYPMVARNEYNPFPTDANCWYKCDKRAYPVSVPESGEAERIEYGEEMTLEDNYKRDSDGKTVYFEYAGGGDFDTAQYRIRVLYYNYFKYKNGVAPNYIFGTDSSGYDLATRLASGIRLSLLVAFFVSAINLFFGTVYGAIEGYYGGSLDIGMERFADVLSNVPFIVVATLFQIHLASKVGVIPSLLFAFVLTGWIGTARRVRAQFYRFKNQEYVMAARTLGASDARIIFKHIFPNTLGTVITASVLVIPGVIFSESMLSFLGIVNLGGKDVTSLGTLLSEAGTSWTNYPHLMLFPAMIISLLMICFNLFGNGLRDAFNPKLRGVEE